MLILPFWIVFDLVTKRQTFYEAYNKMESILKQKKIGVSVHYNKVIPQMTYYKKKYNLNKKDFKNAIEYSRTNISLPVYPRLKTKEIKYICQNLIKIVNE